MDELDNKRILRILRQILKNQAHLLALSHIGAKDDYSDELERNTKEYIRLLKGHLD